MGTTRGRWIAAATAALLAGCGGGDVNRAERQELADSGPASATVGAAATSADAPMDTTPAGTPAVPAPATVREGAEDAIVVRLREYAIDLERDTLPAGDVTFQVVNAGAVIHALEVEGPGVDEESARVHPGGTTTLSVKLRPGTYELTCPDDEAGRDDSELGMRRTLVVTP